MSSKHWTARAILALATFILLAGCSGKVQNSVEPTVDLQPTFNSVATQSVQTVVAGMTLNAPTAVPATATSAPTETTAPTDTPVPTETPVPPTNTPTLIPWTNTPRATATYSYLCTVNLSEPKFGQNYGPNEPFDGKWTVTNTSDKTWSSGEVDFKYISGTKFQENRDLLDLSSDVAKGGTATVVIDMLAPKSAGRYSATWAFVQGSNILCPVYVTINVQ